MKVSTDEDVMLYNFSHAAVVNELRRQVKETGSQQAWADKHGFSQSYISHVLTGFRPATEALANVLGFTGAMFYREQKPEGRKLTKSSAG